MALQENNEGSEPFQLNVKSLEHGVSLLYENEEFWDVEFKIGNRSFKGHRLILGARSPAFEEMLLKPIANNDVPVSKIVISGVTEKGFEILLRYMYTNEISKTDENYIMEAYKAGQLYGSDAFLEKCEDIVSLWNITVDDVCERLNKVYEMPTQLLRCCFFIQNNDQAVLNSPGFLKTEPSVMDALLQEKCFGQVPPTMLITRAIKWAVNQFPESAVAENKALIREVLHNSRMSLLGKLGFETLNSHELGSIIKDNPNLLTLEEQAKLYQNLFTHPRQILPEWSNLEAV